MSLYLKYNSAKTNDIGKLKRHATVANTRAMSPIKEVVR